jgi:phage tail sheath protein FI
LLATRITSSLANGADGVVTAGNIQSALNKVANPDSEDVSLIITGPATEATVENAITLAETRKDCVVFVSPEKADVVDNSGSETTDVLAFRNALHSSSYVVMDSGWKYQYDKYNDVYRWVPLNGDIAGLCARTDLERDPWFSPAGTSRGVIRNVIKLAWNPTKANRDSLYNAGVNPVVTFQGEGTVLFGDKTMLDRPSAFDRINVRRLFITLEKAVSRAARSSLFEFNDAFTRAQFVNLVEPYLRDVQGRRGITDFRVVCDDTNNTAEVIDRNEFVGDIYIKPARSVNFIQLNFVAVRSGVVFEEIVGRAV